MDVRPALARRLGGCAGATLGFPVPSQNGGDSEKFCGPSPMAVGATNVKPLAVRSFMHGNATPPAVGAFSDIQWYYLLIVFIVYCMQKLLILSKDRAESLPTFGPFFSDTADKGVLLPRTFPCKTPSGSRGRGSFGSRTHTSDAKRCGRRP